MSNLVFQDRIKSRKLFLCLTTLATFVVDLILAVILGLGGELFSFGLPIFIILLLDALLMLGVTLSNFRLKYSRTIPIIYIVLSFVAGLLVAPYLARTIFTIVAFVLFGIFRLFSIIALIFGIINGANRSSGIKIVTLVLTFIFVGVSVVYVGNVFPNGFYGQGEMNVRNISYEYDEDRDGYVANLIDNNKGETIIVANEFNGKKVVGINSNILSCEDVLEVKLECDAGFYIQDEEGLENLNSALIISVDKENVDEIRNHVYSIAKDKSSSFTSTASNYVEFANQITPSGLADNQVYITFDYSHSDLKYAKYEVIDTWIGEKGEVFDLVEHASGVSYFKDYDLRNETFLKENYDRGGKVVSALLHEGVEIIGNPVNVSMPDTKIAFEYIRKLIIQEDNDTVYNLFTEDRAFSNAGNARYVLESDPFDTLSTIKQRAGFTVSFKYSRTLGGAKTSFTTLKNILSEDVFVAPEWQLNKPKITAIEKNQNKYIYGDTLNLSATATHPAGDTFEYVWTKDKNGSANISSSSTYNKTNVIPKTDTDVYKLTVTAKPACTSLVSTDYVSISIVVNKKTLNFSWDKSETIYSGEDQNITASYSTSDVINSDTIEGYIDGDNSKTDFTSVSRDAGEYNYSVKLTGECNDLYVVNSTQINHSWTIKPYEVSVVWNVGDYVYDKTHKIPTINSVNGIGDESSTALAYDISNSLGDGIKAGSHTSKVEFTDSTIANNYKIVNATQVYTIAPKKISLSWTGGEFTYNANTQVPSASAEADDLCDGDICEVNVAGGRKNVGDYTATATLSNANYSIKDGDESKPFKIVPKQITLSWTSSTLTYSATNQVPEAIAQGTCPGDVIEFDYTGHGKVVDGYTATATIKNNNNYVITGPNTCDFDIVPKEVTLSWGNTSKVYSGVAQKPTVTINGVCTGDTCQATVELDGAVNVGAYTAIATINNSNYKLTSNSTQFNITKQTLIITANNASIIYGEAPTNNGVSYSGFVNGENSSLLSGTLNYTYNYNQYGNVGSYRITPTGYANPQNYSITYKYGTLAVSARPLTVKIDDKTSIYGMTEQTLTANITSGNLVNSDATPYTLSMNAGANKNAGKYDIVGSTKNNNYAITFEKGEYTITKATLTVTANSITEVTYGYTGSINYKASYTTNNGKSPYVTYSSSVTPSTNVGEYDYTVNFDATNYELVKINPENFKVKVNAKQVTMTWTANAEYSLETYTEYVPVVQGATLSSLDLTYTYTAVTGTVVDNKPTKAGEYLVTVTSNNSNYQIVGTLSAQFTIIAG